MLSQNVNGWLRRSDSNHFVRTLGEWGPDYHGKARAIMSDRYKAIDNDAVLGNLFPQLEQAGAVVESSEITDTKFYLKVRFPEFEREVALNDPVQAGVVISNSEVGYGSTSVQMLIYRLVCTNGMIAASPAFRARKNHIGKQLEYDDHFNIVASSETQQLIDQAFFAQLKDMIKAATDLDVWADMVSMLSDSTGRRINGKIDDVVDRVRKVVGLQNEEASSVLDRLARDGDMSQWGLANAITRTAQDLQSYDRATELERIGGRIVELSNSEWERIAA